ncbi:hypothetical protein C0J50_18668 [Silurus asotus]|uniref:Uncharacterized protein n=1 Tax=Silurus asotus TaxID=30991 RepID=A0AAD5FM84_SILAS|nr:hypothetical protein C0J50_18668 [Silurus asotus]
MDAIVRKSLASCVSGWKDGFDEKEKAVRRKSAPCCHSHITYDSSWIRAYQAELHRERQTPQDRKHFKTKSSQKKDDSLFGAFQGLSLDMDGVRSFKPTAPSAEQCKVM